MRRTTRRTALFIAAVATALVASWSVPGLAFADTFEYSATYSGNASGTFYFTHCDTNEYGYGGCATYALPWTGWAKATYDLYYNANGFYWISWIKDEMNTCIDNAQNSGLPMTVSAGAQDNHYEWDNQYVKSAQTANLVAGLQAPNNVCIDGWQALHDDYYDPMNETQNAGWTDDPGTYTDATWTLANFDVGNG